MTIPTLPKPVSLAILIGLATLCLVHCGKEAATNPEGCAERGDRVTAGASEAEPAFKVVSPDGGESFKVGDSITVRLGANSKGTSALAYLIIRTPVSVVRLRLPGTPATRDMNPRTDCDVSFRIPATIVESGAAISLVSSEVKIRVAAYNSETLYNDESDGFFSILP